MTLTLDDKVVATGQAPDLLPRQPTENFCVGHDDGKPATVYSSAVPFKGTIKGLKVTAP